MKLTSIRIFDEAAVFKLLYIIDLAPASAQKSAARKGPLRAALYQFVRKKAQGFRAATHLPYFSMLAAASAASAPCVRI